VAKPAAAFGLRVIACDPYVPADAMREAGVTPEDMEELLRSADCLTLHVPLTPTTHHIVGRRELSVMKRGAVLINTARGKLINQESLRDSLRNGHIRAAGLDVLEVEPPDPAEPLVRMDNVVMTPHSAAFPREAIEQVYQTTVEDVLRVLQGTVPHHPAPGAQAWQRGAGTHEV